MDRGYAQDYKAVNQTWDALVTSLRRRRRALLKLMKTYDIPLIDGPYGDLPTYVLDTPFFWDMMGLGEALTTMRIPGLSKVTLKDVDTSLTQIRRETLELLDMVKKAKRSPLPDIKNQELLRKNVNMWEKALLKFNTVHYWRRWLFDAKMVYEEALRIQKKYPNPYL